MIGIDVNVNSLNISNFNPDMRGKMGSSVLVANRGEIAIRIMRAANELGMRTVAVYPDDDAGSLHVKLADRAWKLEGVGVAAYLDAEQVVAAAKETGCEIVHPGYGFLSENADFARLCESEGLTFVGPDSEVLQIFGDKVKARELAQKFDVPVLPGTVGDTSLLEVRAFAAEHGSVMLKAVAGGGGRGMRAVLAGEPLAEAYERCGSEARQAFGESALYVEKLLVRPRHIEVQIVGDGTGAVTHLWERDCSIQRQHQKLVEVAPSPALDQRVREQILDAAVRLAGNVGYRSLGTFEFLLSGEQFWFIEANPRLQVEHTVTEEITGIDLVQTQLRIAGGASLSDVGLEASPPVVGSAIQVRVNLETLTADGQARPGAGTLTSFTVPAGPGVRVDTFGYAGYRTSLRYDSLLAKVVSRSSDFAGAVTKAYNALCEFNIDGVPTNRSLLQSILGHPDFSTGKWDTSFVAEHLSELLDESHPRKYFDFPDVKALAPQTSAESNCAPPGTTAVTAQMPGTVLTVNVVPGDRVTAGARLAVLEAMKMEHVLRANAAGVVRSVLVAEGDIVQEGVALAFIEDAATDGQCPEWVGDDGEPSVISDWSTEVDEIDHRRAIARRMGGPEKIARQRAAGKLTVRERIDALADPGSFHEIGSLTGFAEYSDTGELESFLPANFVAGTAQIDKRKVVLGADDFTVRGSSGDGAVYAKQIFLEEYARDMRLPMIRLMDGASGGGSVKMIANAGYTYVPVIPGWDAVVENLSLVPVIAACLGPTVGLGAARAVMAHLTIAVQGTGQLFTAGPPVVRGGTGEDLSAEELGGVDVHHDSGAVDRFVGSEEHAFAVIRQFLSYLPESVFGLPPVVNCSDSPDRMAEELLSAIPRNRREVYRLQPILDAIFDEGSVFEYAEYGGATVTALARLDGHPVGVLATDPDKGATMSAEGAMAITRLVDLCETFHLPIVSLTDQAGMTIGRAAEQRATIRHGARAISAVYQARVPQAEIILRRVYGVGGAGIVNRHSTGRTWAWPSGDWGSLPAEGGIEAAFRAELRNADDPRREIENIRARLATVASPFRTAERFGVQDLIDPRQSRSLLCSWVHDAYRVLPELIGRPSFGARP